MKLAITGKGGVGKTTTSALLACALNARGEKVVAIDADPDANLLACMGYPDPASVSPLVELKGLIEERTGVKPGTTGGMFQLNPTVDDIPGKYGVDIDGIRVLVAGAVKKGGAGCYCPENALLRALISHLVFDEQSSLVLDMEAGIEHLTRGTVKAIDHLLVVVDPGRRSVETAQRIGGLARDLGMGQVLVVGNRIRSAQDEAFLRGALPAFNFAGFIPYDEQVVDVERSGEGLVNAENAATDAMKGIIDFLKKHE